MIEQLLTGAGIGIVYALLTYFQKTLKGGFPSKQEVFDWVKLSRTIVVGIAIGGFAQYSGYSLTAENYDIYLTANAGLVAGVDKAIIIVGRLISKLKND
jgi:hypothetical protein